MNYSQLEVIQILEQAVEDWKNPQPVGQHETVSSGVGLDLDEYPNTSLGLCYYFGNMRLKTIDVYIDRDFVTDYLSDYKPDTTYHEDFWYQTDDLGAKLRYSTLDLALKEYKAMPEEVFKQKYSA